MSEPDIFQGRPSWDLPAYTQLDEEAETRRAEARYESWFFGEHVGYVPPANPRRIVSLVKQRPRMSGDELVKLAGGLSPEYVAARVAEERARFGPDVRIKVAGRWVS